VAADPALGDQVGETLLDLLPAVAASLAAPERGEDTDWDALGASADEIRAVALRAEPAAEDHRRQPLWTATLRSRWAVSAAKSSA
jgi:hypothetical protein